MKRTTSGKGTEISILFGSCFGHKTQKFKSEMQKKKLHLMTKIDKMKTGTIQKTVGG